MRIFLLAVAFVLGGCTSHKAVSLDSLGSSIVDSSMPDPHMPDGCYTGRRDLCPAVTLRNASPGPFLPSP